MIKEVKFRPSGNRKAQIVKKCKKCKMIYTLDELINGFCPFCQEELKKN